MHETAWKPGYVSHWLGLSFSIPTSSSTQQQASLKIGPMGPASRWFSAISWVKSSEVKVASTKDSSTRCPRIFTCQLCWSHEMSNFFLGHEVFISKISNRYPENITKPIEKCELKKPQWPCDWSVPKSPRSFRSFWTSPIAPDRSS